MPQKCYGTVFYGAFILRYFYGAVFYSPSVTFFANKHDYTIKKELRQEATSFV